MIHDMAEFDYNAAVADIEKLVQQMENPETGVEQAEKMSVKARELLEKCRAYLREERQK